MGATWTAGIQFVNDQVVDSTKHATQLLDNLLYLREKMAVRHNVVTGEHDDPLISHIQGLVKYTGTYGGGGSWAVEDGAGFTVADLGTPAAGKGQLSFSTAYASSGLAPQLCSRAANNAADSADSPTADVWRVHWYDQATTGFKFAVANNAVAANTWAYASNGAKFSVACMGDV